MIGFEREVECSPYLRLTLAHRLDGAETLVAPSAPLDEVQWEHLIAEVEAQRVWSLFTDAVISGAFPATAAQIEQCVEADERSVLSCLELDRMLVCLDTALGVNGISTRVFKGVASALLLYPDARLRTYSDVDLLVRQTDFDEAGAVFVALGGRRQNADPRAGFVGRYGKSAAYTMPGGWEVDVHRSPQGGPFGAAVAIDDLFDNPIQLDMAGRTVLCPSLSALFLTSCYHAVLPSDRRRLVPLRDVAQTVLLGALDNGEVIAMAERWRGTIVMAAAIRSASDLFGLPNDLPLVSWSRRYQPDGRERRWLAGYTAGSSRAMVVNDLRTGTAFPSMSQGVGYFYGVAFHEGRSPLPVRARSLLARLRETMNVDSGAVAPTSPPLGGVVPLSTGTSTSSVVDDVELLTIGNDRALRHGWPGPQRSVRAETSEIASALSTTTTRAVLCLHSDAPIPDGDLIESLLAGPGDAWHAGLSLGLDGQPAALDSVAAQWMLNAPADPALESTSWRVSLHALLVRREVLEQLGTLDPRVTSLTGAGLEAGLRWIRGGALVRNVPALATDYTLPLEVCPPDDAIGMIATHYGRRWATWALGRGILDRSIAVRDLPRLARLGRSRPMLDLAFFDRPVGAGALDRTVSVIVPTVDRYPYLDVLLQQLRAQTVPVHEVLVADQTPFDRRRRDLETIEPALPVTVLGLDRIGQSTARNAAIEHATGEIIMFLDDDDEIPADLVEQHLRLLSDGIDAICGAVDDATAGPPPPGFRHRQASAVFPTNHSTVRRTALARSGIFDPVFDHGPRADHDVGMRLHLAGCVLIYDPSVSVYHHHASTGGLRTHGARKTTRASARRSLTERNLPSTTECYIGLRYYRERQRREARAIRVLSALSGDGTRSRRLARAMVQIMLLPNTLERIRRSEREAAAVMQDRPRIPGLDAEPSDAAQAAS